MRLSTSVGSTDATQGSQGSTPTAKTGGASGQMGTQTVQLTRGQQIQRNIANFFKTIGKPIMSLHNRVQAHQAKQKDAANLRSAQGAAKNVLKGLGKDTSDVKMATLLPALLAKAAKLDSKDPTGKAVALLEAAAKDSDKGKLLDATDWKGMEKVIDAVIDFRMGRGQAVEASLVRMGFGDKDHVTTNHQIDSTKSSVKSLLTELQKKTDSATAAMARSDQAETAKKAMTTKLGELKLATTIDAKLGCLSDVLDLYLDGSVKPGDVFRLNSPATTAIADMMKQISSHRKDEVTSEFMAALDASSTNELPDTLLDHGKLNDRLITGEQFEPVLDVAERLMTEMVGGLDPKDVRAAANRVPDDAVRVLKLIDEKVQEHFPGNASMAANAFIGSQFLRFEVPFTTEAAFALKDTDPVKGAVGRMAGGVANTTFNAAASGQADKSSRFQPEVGTAYDAFVAKYADSVDLFRTTVLSRDVA